MEDYIFRYRLNPPGGRGRAGGGDCSPRVLGDLLKSLLDM